MHPWPPAPACTVTTQRSVKGDRAYSDGGGLRRLEGMGEVDVVGGVVEGTETSPSGRTSLAEGTAIVLVGRDWQL